LKSGKLAQVQKLLRQINQMSDRKSTVDARKTEEEQEESKYGELSHSDRLAIIHSQNAKHHSIFITYNQAKDTSSLESSSNEGLIDEILDKPNKEESLLNETSASKSPMKGKSSGISSQTEENEELDSIQPSKKRKVDSKKSTSLPSAASLAHEQVIEMCDPISGRVLSVFSSSTQAAEFILGKPADIIKACMDGGAMVGRRYFRYKPVSVINTLVNDNVEVNNTSNNVEESTEKVDDSTNQVSPPDGNLDTMNMKVDDDNYDVDDDDNPEIVYVRQGDRNSLTADVHIPQPDTAGSIDKSGASVPVPKAPKAQEVARKQAEPNILTKLPFQTSKTLLPLSKESVYTKSQGSKGGEPVLKTSKVVTAQKPKPLPHFFDYSTLRPIRKKTKPLLRQRRTIELVELRSQKVLVVFRGSTDASRALDIDRKDVSTACEAYIKGTPLHFDTFTLRYAPPGQFSAYIYGDHPDDFKKLKAESHKEIAARFKKVFQEKKQNGTLGEPSPCMYSFGATNTLSIIESLPESTMNSRDEESEHNNRRRPRQGLSDDLSESTQRLLESSRQCSQPIRVSALQGGLDAHTVCLICQTNPPRIVFEPCHHAVLCASCAKTSCHYFCPVCHTPITRRVEPRSAILLRPRIFSAYSFLSNAMGENLNPPND
jgi:Zinc finger, C3HC4 type (RING finger)